jgi:predicted dehydrogenase
MHDALQDLDIQGTVRRTGDGAVPDDWREPFSRQLSNFVAAIRGEAELVVPAEAGLRSLALMERCRAVGQPLPVADWEHFHGEVAR